MIIYLVEPLKIKPPHWSAGWDLLLINLFLFTICIFLNKKSIIRNRKKTTLIVVFFQNPLVLKKGICLEKLLNLFLN